METNELVIQIKETAVPEHVLANFPYMTGQKFDRIEEDESDGTQWIFIDLAERTDTTTYQETHLNADNRVLYYAIR